MIVAWVVWSRGLERWEQIHLSMEDVRRLKIQHVKNVNGREFTVWLDLLNRYVGSIHADSPEWSIMEIPKLDIDDKVALVDVMSELVALDIDEEILR